MPRIRRTLHYGVAFGCGLRFATNLERKLLAIAILGHRQPTCGVRPYQAGGTLGRPSSQRTDGLGSGTCLNRSDQTVPIRQREWLRYCLRSVPTGRKAVPAAQMGLE